MPHIHAEPMDAALLQDRIEALEDPGCTTPENDREVMMLRHIRHLEEEVERQRYAHQCTTEDMARLEKSYRLLEADATRLVNQLNQAKGKR